jgi:IS5 family transposase
LGDEICALYQVRDALEAQIARRLAAFARTDGWADEQVTVGAWLRTQTTMSHGQTAAQTRVARAQEQLPELAACWQAGRISFAHW